MSDDLKKLQDALTAVQGHLQDLQGEQNATTRELKKHQTQTALGFKALEQSIKSLDGTLQAGLKALTARSMHLEAGLSALAGTFTSIEQILTRVFEDRARGG